MNLLLPMVAFVFLLASAAHAVPAQFKLTWKAGPITKDAKTDTTPKGFNVERSADKGKSWANVAKTTTVNAPAVETHVDTVENTGKGGLEFCYRVAAYNDSGVSGFSNTACGVTAAIAPAVLAITPDKTSPGEQTVLTWSGIANPKPNDWVGFFDAAQSNSNWQWRLFTGGNCQSSPGTVGRASGTCKPKMPQLPGKYQFRMFLTDAPTVVAASVDVEVIVVAPPAPPAIVTPGVPAGLTLE